MKLKAIKKVSAIAPATCANVAVGFDILGFAVDCLVDEVTLGLRHDKHLVIESIQGENSLPLDVEKNTATVALQAMKESLSISAGFSVSIKKGIPLSSGLGGSAASAVAAITALNAFLESPLTKEALIPFALKAEAIVSGEAHGDNIIPCLWGAFTLVHRLSPPSVIVLPTPPLYVVLIHPQIEIQTKKARDVLSETIDKKKWVAQSANLATFISALYQQDMTLIKKSCVDLIIEPQRMHLLPPFEKIKKAALHHDAMACSFSGAGSTMFAFAENEYIANEIKEAMLDVLMIEGLQANGYVCRLQKVLPRIVSED